MNTWRHTLWTAALACVALLTVACGSAAAGDGTASAQRVTVQLSEFRFDPPTATVQVNEPVQVTVKNAGTVTHDWTVQGLDQPVQASAAPGSSATVEFTPRQSGTFRVVCTQPGHEQAGMVGQLVVK